MKVTITNPVSEQWESDPLLTADLIEGCYRVLWMLDPCNALYLDLLANQAMMPL